MRICEITSANHNNYAVHFVACQSYFDQVSYLETIQICAICW